MKVFAALTVLSFATSATLQPKPLFELEGTNVVETRETNTMEFMYMESITKKSNAKDFNDNVFGLDPSLLEDSMLVTVSIMKLMQDEFLSNGISCSQI